MSTRKKPRFTAVGNTSITAEDALTAAGPKRAPRQPAEKTTLVRMVTELQVDEDRALRRLTLQLAEDIGVTSVAMSQVVRVLLELAHEDPALVDRVRERLEESGSSRRR